MKKSLKLAAAGLLAALSLSLVKPVRVWASQEGSYIYHAFFINGPATFYGAGGTTSWTGNDGVARSGVTISTGTPTTAAAVVMNLIGAVTTAARPASPVEGMHGYDATVHSLTFYDGTRWHKLVYNAGTNGDSWTAY